jgi:hypothetical protein
VIACVGYAGIAMKLAIGLFVVLWLLCGWAAASWMHDHSFKTIALGPISLAQAYNDNPVSYPGPN